MHHTPIRRMLLSSNGFLMVFVNLTTTETYPSLLWFDIHHGHLSHIPPLANATWTTLLSEGHSWEKKTITGICWQQVLLPCQAVFHTSTAVLKH